MTEYQKTIRTNLYWILKGQSEIFKMLKSKLKNRGDKARLAEKMNTTTGYVSQLMDGEREMNFTWKKIVDLCLAMDKVPVLNIMDIQEYENLQKKNASLLKFNLPEVRIHANELKYFIVGEKKIKSFNMGTKNYLDLDALMSFEPLGKEFRTDELTGKTLQHEV